MSALINMARKAKHGALHWRVRALTRRDWRERFHKVYALNPDYARPCAPGVEAEHAALWKPLWRRVSLDTLRVCRGVAGRAPVEIMPEEIYAAEVERRLNARRMIDLLAHKSAYARWFDQDAFPVTWLHDVDGIRYDREFHRVSDTAAGDRAAEWDYPVVLKPNLDSSGGKDVHFVETPERLRAMIRGKRNFVVQERIEGHPYFSRFSPVGLNTLRVCLYRSVRDERVHVLNVALRMGKGGSLDNLTAGGIACYVNADGRLNPYAVDKYGVRFSAHPDNGIVFAELDPIPGFDGIEALAVHMAEQIYLARVVSLDLALDANGRWRVIEINLFNQTIRFAQYAGHPFFGPFTREVIEYCLQRPWV
ncbi:MAG: hypothetical protein JW951_04875 [Lentisphaerae bacterium]|nr:hypothetical protein [Lentisphaerota bacterium]